MFVALQALALVAMLPDGSAIVYCMWYKQSHRFNYKQF